MTFFFFKSPLPKESQTAVYRMVPLSFLPGPKVTGNNHPNKAIPVCYMPKPSMVALKLKNLYDSEN